MINTLTEMQQNLEEGFFVAFVSSNEDHYFPLTKSDTFDFLDSKTLAIHKRSGRNIIINLNLIVGICIKRELI